MQILDRTCIATHSAGTAALMFCAGLLMSTAAVAAADLRTMSAPDLRALQQQLTDARSQFRVAWSAHRS